MRLSHGGKDAELSLSLGLRDEEIPLSSTDGRTWTKQRPFEDENHHARPHIGVRTTLTVTELGHGRWRYIARLDSDVPVRLIIRLSTPAVHRVFHLLPGVIFGDNNVNNMNRRAINYLTHADIGDATGKASPMWSMRADRCAAPLSAMIGEGTLAAISVMPYSDHDSQTFPGSPGFVRNGVGAELADADRPPAVLVSLGYRNMPYWYNRKTSFTRPTEHVVQSGSVEGMIFLRAADDRRALHEVVDAVYREYHGEVEPRLTREAATTAVAQAVVTHSYHGESGELYEWFEKPGTQRYDHRGPAMEIAWTGGTAIAWPLLLAARINNNSDWDRAARTILDTVSDPSTINPATGFLWDYASTTRGRSTSGWWVHAAGSHHFAYTNGQAASFLLEAANRVRQAGETVPSPWISTPIEMLTRLIQREDQRHRFAYAYSAENGDIIEPGGFAGCWFVPALVRATALTSERRYIEAAKRAADSYYQDVLALCAFGAPMDTDLAPDSEGVLAFIRAARLLHESTDDDRYLEMIEDGLRFEYLWRYGYRARPEQPPLRGSFWTTCGGSLTSVANPTIHPMSVMTAGDAEYLLLHGGDPVHRQRLQDQLNWACQTVALHPNVAGFGELGVINERYSPSDGFIVDRYADGTDSAIGFIYHPWAASCILEGLLSTTESIAPRA